MELGVDLVEIGRIRDLASRSPRFLRRVFSASEISYCKAKKNPWPHFAVRFAAKEAVYKALGKADVPLTAISVVRDAKGRPTVRIAGKPAPRIKLSLSHGRDHAVAFAVRLVALTIILLAASAGRASADEPGKIQDNSFLIEEAYNQERGIIQHIQTFQYLERSKSWAYSFTQEWPVPGQTHQLSYTIPALRPGPPGTASGLGDVLLNYRYQAWAKGRTAFAPRASLILPTGDDKKGLGAGVLGYQVNLPLSVELSDDWVTHWNLGGTWTPQSKEPGGAKANTLGYNYGASLIWLAAKNFNLMFEAARNSFETVQSDGAKNRQDTFFLNPGARFAINFKSGLQIVPGFSMPIGVGPSHKEWGVLTYLSFEHPLF